MKETNLTIENLHIYLPHKLEFYVPDDEYEEIQTMTGISYDDGFQTDYTKPTKESTYGNYWSFEGEKNYESYGVKPILKSIADEDLSLNFDNEITVSSIKYLEESSRLTHNPIDLILRAIHYKDLQVLLKHHFDVQGLLRLGLAITQKEIDEKRK